MRPTIALAGFLTATLASAAYGQAPTTVQLPTFHFFTVQTAVSVPDRGGTTLGSLQRALEGSRARGLGKGPLLGNRATSSARTGGGMSVHATIHDLAAMDEALLSAAASKRRGTGDLPVDVAPGLTAPVAAGVESLAEIRDRNAHADAAEAAEIATLFAKAQQAEVERKPVVARLYYQMVARRAQGDLKQLALIRIDVLSGRAARVVGNP